MKQGRPVLYELLSAQVPVRAASPSSNGHHGPPRIEGLPAEVEPVRWIAPGSAVRVPYGYLFIGVAIVIVLAVAAFMFGYTRGQDETEAQFTSNEQAGDEAASIGRAASGQPRSGSAGAGVEQGTLQSGEANLTTIRGGAGAIESDPRQPGLNYFYLIQRTSRDGALAVAEFCRASGLEAYVVGANNGREFTVFVLPGHLAEDRQSDAVKALEGRVEDIKLRWKARFGRDDIGISLEKFKG